MHYKEPIYTRQHLNTPGWRLENPSRVLAQKDFRMKESHQYIYVTTHIKSDYLIIKSVVLLRGENWNQQHVNNPEMKKKSSGEVNK
jgi:hypothetical protein